MIKMLLIWTQLPILKLLFLKANYCGRLLRQENHGKPQMPINQGPGNDGFHEFVYGSTEE